ncbi:hypothetical protein PanWU01x14_025820 [Parasponia andersonii]|uniref:Uncharacterized protein n=1 Tax=Parasponia andersonii TaxID=3476 RepID=A0A2P5DVV6_PARAD|nr:hypothetical protein PanWU01x14_025820 [Parasponia andersonii]
MHHSRSSPVTDETALTTLAVNRRLKPEIICHEVHIAVADFHLWSFDSCRFATPPTLLNSSHRRHNFLTTFGY